MRMKSGSCQVPVGPEEVTRGHVHRPVNANRGDRVGGGRARQWNRLRGGDVGKKWGKKCNESQKAEPFWEVN